MEKKTNQTIFSIFSLLLLFSSCVSAQLRTGFYQNSCPNVESIVRNAVRQKFQQTFVTAPATLRLFFHDCFVRVRNDFNMSHIGIHVILLISNVQTRKYFLCKVLKCMRVIIFLTNNSF